MKKSNVAGYAFPEKFKLHEDARHGWLEVPYGALEELKIEEAISGYSYINGDTVYLEEDLDLAIFVQAWLQYHGKSRKDFKAFGDHLQDVWDGAQSYIRSFEHYMPR